MPGSAWEAPQTSQTDSGTAATPCPPRLEAGWSSCTLFSGSRTGVGWPARPPVGGLAQGVVPGGLTLARLLWRRCAGTGGEEPQAPQCAVEMALPLAVPAEPPVPPLLWTCCQCRQRPVGLLLTTSPRLSPAGRHLLWRHLHQAGHGPEHLRGHHHPADHHGPLHHHRCASAAGPPRSHAGCVLPCPLSPPPPCLLGGAAPRLESQRLPWPASPGQEEPQSPSSACWD